MECYFRLKDLKHYNGRSVIELYGEWGTLKENHHVSPGPVISFNIIRSDGSYVGYNEVSKLAALSNTPIQLRTGCFCNPGACQEALKMDEEKAKYNYERSGKICGDHLDVIDGSPTGAIRISIGKDSIWEDVETLILFLQRTFVSRRSALSLGVQDKRRASSTTQNEPEKLRLQDIYLFPIKSCAGKCLYVQSDSFLDSSNEGSHLVIVYQL